MITQPDVIPFTVMAKPVGARCNMRCSYCYYLNTKTGGQSESMTEAILERFIRQYIEASAGPVVNFVWHGGEPTLAGLDFYRRAVALQRRYLPSGWECWNNLQTNGIQLDEKWCSFLAENAFDVGLSIDGTQWLHDAHRKDANGNGTYHAAAGAIRRLQEHGIQPDLLCTVNSLTASEPLAVYSALRAFETGWIQFIPVVRRGKDGAAAPGSVRPEDYGEFLCRVFDEWILNDLGRLEVQMFAETARIRAGGSAGLCWMAPVCGRALIVEQDGSVYSCDHFADPAHKIGDIETGRLGQLANLPEQQRFGEAKRSRLPARCRVCPWLAVCGGGCPKDRFAKTEDGAGDIYYLCGGLERFFTYTHPAFTRLIEYTKAGLSPVSIMARLREELRALWKGVGRNDPCPCGSGRKAKHCCWGLGFRG